MTLSVTSSKSVPKIQSTLHYFHVTLRFTFHILLPLPSFFLTTKKKKKHTSCLHPLDKRPVLYFNKKYLYSCGHLFLLLTYCISFSNLISAHIQDNMANYQWCNALSKVTKNCHYSLFVLLHHTVYVFCINGCESRY